MKINLLFQKYGHALVFAVIAGGGLGTLAPLDGFLSRSGADSASLIGQAESASKKVETKTGDVQPADADQTAVVYREYACPTSEEFNQFVKDVHFADGPDEVSCETDVYGRLGRVLKFMADLKVDESGLGDLGKTSKPVKLSLNPFRFLGSANRGMKLSAGQPGAIAYNDNGMVNLGPRTFEAAPLEVALYLMHESWHSTPDDARHRGCLKGDLVGVTQACDAEFRIDEKMGAYNFQVLTAFAWSAAGENLSDAQREYLKTTGLWLLASRFNKMDDSLALSFEQIMVLNQKNEVFWMNPWSGELVPQELKLPVSAKILRLESADTGRPLFFTDLGIFKARGNEPLSDVGIESKGMRDFTGINVRVSALMNMRVIVYLDAAGKMRVVEPKGKKVVDRESNCVGPVPFSRVRQTGNGYDFLDSDGKLWNCSVDRPMALVDSARGGRYDFLSGGLFQKHLYLIDDAGKLLYQEYGRLMESKSNSYGPIRKFEESASFRSYLLKSGNLIFRSWDGDITSRWSAPAEQRIVDYTVTRAVEPLLRLQVKTSDFGLAEFKGRCELERAVQFATSNDFLGVNRDGQLVQWLGDECKVLDLSRRGLENRDFKALYFMGSGTDDSALGGRTGELTLVKTNGDRVRLRPYFF